MKINSIHIKSIRYYRQYYRLTALAVIVMMAVLSGSMLLGDSVRGTLVDRVTERLGSTETVIASGTGFINDEIMNDPLLVDAKGYLVCEGFVSTGEKLHPVMVWSCDDDSIARGSAVVNEPLSRLLADSDFVLHLPSHSLVPSGSLFVTESYSTQMRLHTAAVRTVGEGGNMLLHNEQALPLNVFVNRQELAEMMELEGKINLIMSDATVTDADLAEAWSAELSGLHIDGDKVTSDRIFLPESVVQALCPATLCYAYLVNDIRTEGDSIPYSFVTATNSFMGEPLAGNETILSDYAASRLNAHVGDTVAMDYFITREMKSLETRSHSFVVKAVLPLSAFQSDSLLMTEYPGLSNVEHCNDWDSDLPIDMDRITKEDENFWYTYRHTPKALVAYDAVSDDWSTSFGVATALRLSAQPSPSSDLDYHQFNITLVHPREAAIYAAQNGTDFTSLFLALGFFIILSAVLLMQSPLTEMLSQRSGEIQLLSALGYSPTRIYSILLREVGLVVLGAAPVGVLCGILYSGTTLWLLGNVWSGATHTEGFRLHISVATLLVAFIVGVLICALTAWLAIRSFLKPKASSKSMSTSKSTSRSKSTSLILFAVTIVLFVCNLLSAQSIILFVVCGLTWIVASGLAVTSFISREAHASSLFSADAMRWKTLDANRSQTVLAFWSLAIGVFTVFAVGLNRPDFSHSADDAEMTGGFDLWCECRVPMEYDLNNADVRRKLSLQDIDDGVSFMQILKHTQDEASCLNLNKVSTPTVLGVDIQQLHSAFGIDTSCLEQCSDSVYPVMVDSESLMWSMMKSVGDTLTCSDSEGRAVRLLIAGNYPVGIFHGNALMNKDYYRMLWSDDTGSRLILARTGPDLLHGTKETMETALSQYGINISTTTERMQMFFTVTDTYLAIFLTLGGLGLLLGIFCLIIVIRKNLAARQTEVGTLLALGYTHTTIRRRLFHENLVVPMCAVVSGAIGSLLSISANAGGAGFATILTAVVLLAALLALVYYGIKRMIIDSSVFL